MGRSRAELCDPDSYVANCSQPGQHVESGQHPVTILEGVITASNLRRILQASHYFHDRSNNRTQME